MCYIRLMTRSSIAAGALRVTYEQHGPDDGWPCVLGHGFPYDIHAYAEVVPKLAEAGARVIVPYLRGFGPTRFLSSDAPRSGEQGALGADLLALLDALGIERAVLGGYDWGGRAACVVSAFGRIAPPRWCREIPTISRISPGRRIPRHQRKKPRSGISTIFIASGAGSA